MSGSVNMKSSFAICFVGILCISNAYGQIIPDSVRREAQRIEERESERTKERERIFRDSQIRALGIDSVPEDIQSLDDSNECIVVKAANISGMSRYKMTDFSVLLNGLTGSCTKKSQIENLIRIITNKYVGDGYITSSVIILPEQNKDGVVRIAVIEGRLDIISGELNTDKAKYKTELESAFPRLSGRLLNLRDLEQGVDQLARLSGSDPSIDIVPGINGATSNLIVRRRATAPWIRPSITISNDGSANTGRQVVTASVDIDSPFGAADFWSLYYIQDIQRGAAKGAEGYGGFFSLPYGYTTLFLSGGRYKFSTVLESNDLLFGNTGDSVNGAIGLDHLLFRDRRTKILVSASISFYDTVNRIQDIRLSTNSYRVVSGQVGFRVQRRIGRGLVLADLTLSRGFDIFGADAADIGPGSDGLKFRKLAGNLGYQAPILILGVPTDYSASLRGQWALDSVLPVERLSVGGSSTVRGFRDDGISGQRGAVFRQQFGIGLIKLFSDARTNTTTQLSVIVGYDAGAILLKPSDPFERGFLQSSTLGLRLLNRRMLAEISVAAPLSAPANVQRPRLELSASVRLTI